MNEQQLQEIYDRMVDAFPLASRTSVQDFSKRLLEEDGYADKVYKNLGDKAGEITGYESGEQMLNGLSNPEFKQPEPFKIDFEEIISPQDATTVVPPVANFEELERADQLYRVHSRDYVRGIAGKLKEGEDLSDVDLLAGNRTRDWQKGLDERHKAMKESGDTAGKSHYDMMAVSEQKAIDMARQVQETVLEDIGQEELDRALTMRTAFSDITENFQARLDETLEEIQRDPNVNQEEALAAFQEELNQPIPVLLGETTYTFANYQEYADAIDASEEGDIGDFLNAGRLIQEIGNRHERILNEHPEAKDFLQELQKNQNVKDTFHNKLVTAPFGRGAMGRVTHDLLSATGGALLRGGKDILQLPRSTSDLLGVSGYGWTDSLADWAEMNLDESQYLLTTVPSAYNTQMFGMEAAFDIGDKGFRALFNDEGTELMDVRDSRGYVIQDPQLRKAALREATEAYDNNELDVQKAQRWDQALFKTANVVGDLAILLAGTKGGSALARGGMRAATRRGVTKLQAARGEAAASNDAVARLLDTRYQAIANSKDIPLNVSSVVAGLQVNNDLYNEALRQMGPGHEQEAAYFALTGSILTGLANRISPNLNVIGEGKSTFVDKLTQGYTASLLNQAATGKPLQRKLALKYAADFAFGGVRETIQEVTEDISMGGARLGFNGAVLDPESQLQRHGVNMNHLKELAVLTLATGGLADVTTTSTRYSQLQSQAMYDMYKRYGSVDAMPARLKGQLSENTTQVLDDLFKNLNDAKGGMDLNDAEMVVFTGKMAEAIRLQQASEMGAFPAVRERLQKESDEALTQAMAIAQTPANRRAEILKSIVEPAPEAKQTAEEVSQNTEELNKGLDEIFGPTPEEVTAPVEGEADMAPAEVTRTRLLNTLKRNEAFSDVDVLVLTPEEMVERFGDKLTGGTSINDPLEVARRAKGFMLDELNDAGAPIVVLNANTVNSETPIHEFGHVWAALMRGTGNKAWDRGMDLVKALPDYEARRQEFLKKGYLEDKVDEEILVDALGKRGSEMFDNTEAASAWDAWVDSIKRFLADTFNLPIDKALNELTFDEFTKMAAAELLTGEAVLSGKGSAEATTEQNVQEKVADTQAKRKRKRTRPRTDPNQLTIPFEPEIDPASLTEDEVTVAPEAEATLDEPNPREAKLRDFITPMQVRYKNREVDFESPTDKAMYIASGKSNKRQAALKALQDAGYTKQEIKVAAAPIRQEVRNVFDNYTQVGVEGPLVVDAQTGMFGSNEALRFQLNDAGRQVVELMGQKAALTPIVGFPGAYEINGEAYMELDESLDMAKDKIALAGIYAYKGQQGAGTRAMSLLVNAADDLDLAIELDAVPFGDGDRAISTSKLVEFYEKFGFQVVPQSGMTSRDEIVMSAEEDLGGVNMQRPRDGMTVDGSSIQTIPGMTQEEFSSLLDADQILRKDTYLSDFDIKFQLSQDARPETYVQDNARAAQTFVDKLMTMPGQSVLNFGSPDLIGQGSFVNTTATQRDVTNYVPGGKRAPNVLSSMSDAGNYDLVTMYDVLGGADVATQEQMLDVAFNSLAAGGSIAISDLSLREVQNLSERAFDGQAAAIVSDNGVTKVYKPLTEDIMFNLGREHIEKNFPDLIPDQVREDMAEAKESIEAAKRAKNNALESGDLDEMAFADRQLLVAESDLRAAARRIERAGVDLLARDDAFMENWLIENRTDVVNEHVDAFLNSSLDGSTPHLQVARKLYPQEIFPYLYRSGFGGRMVYDYELGSPAKHVVHTAWRGMSMEEYENAKRNGFIQSTGAENRAGLGTHTFFARDLVSAYQYATRSWREGGPAGVIVQVAVTPSMGFNEEIHFDERIRNELGLSGDINNDSDARARHLAQRSIANNTPHYIATDNAVPMSAVEAVYKVDFRTGGEAKGGIDFAKPTRDLYGVSGYAMLGASLPGGGIVTGVEVSDISEQELGAAAIQFQLDIPSDLKYRGKNLAELGKEHGVPNLGPVSPVEEIREGDRVYRIPGGLEGTFTYADLMVLKAQAYDPNLMSDELRSKLWRKMAQTQTPDVTTDEGKLDVFNRIIFGMLSPNQALTANEFQYLQMRVRNMSELQLLADLVPYDIGDKVSKQQRAALEKEIAQKFGMDSGKYRVAVDGLELVVNRKGQTQTEGAYDIETGEHIKGRNHPRYSELAAARKKYREMEVKPEIVNRGGLGTRGTAEITRIAEAAKLFLKDPDFFMKKADEDWSQFVSRVSSQLSGMSAKVGSFALVWQDPAQAAISAVDRHMARAFYKDVYNTPAKRADFRRRMLETYNRRVAEADNTQNKINALLAKEKLTANESKALGKLRKKLADNPLLPGMPPLQNVDELMNARMDLNTSNGVVKGSVGARIMMDVLFSDLSARELKRTVRGKLNPKIDPAVAGADYVVTPETIQVISDTYQQALAVNDRLAAEQGLSLFNSQWMLWDGFRKRLEPHAPMFPNLYKLPRMEQQELEASMRAHAEAGYTDSTKDKVYNPKTGEVDLEMRGARPADPQALLYFDLEQGRDYKSEIRQTISQYKGRIGRDNLLKAIHEKANKAGVQISMEELNAMYDNRGPQPDNRASDRRKYTARVESKVSRASAQKISEQAKKYIPKSNVITDMEADVLLQSVGHDQVRTMLLDPPEWLLPETRVALANKVVMDLETRIVAAREANNDELANELENGLDAVVTNISEELTRAGRFTQAARMLNALGPKRFAKKVNKISGDRLTEEELGQLEERKRKLDAMEDGFEKSREEFELLKLKDQMLHKHKDKYERTKDVFRAYYYASILSGVSTQKRNIFANFQAALGEMYTVGIRESILQKDPTQFWKSWQGLMYGLKQGAIQGAEIIANGVKHPAVGDKVENPPLFEWWKLSQTGNEWFDGVINKSLWGPDFLKYVNRFMQAGDALFYYAGVGLQEYALAQRIKSRETTGRDKPTQEELDTAAAILGEDSSVLAAAKARAESEGFNPKGNRQERRQYAIRVQELVDMQKEQSVRESAIDFGRRMTFNYEPEGLMGLTYDIILKGRRTPIIGPAITAVVPFARIVSNVFNRGLDWTPYGLYRGARGKVRTSKLGGRTETRENSQQERVDFYIKGSTGLMAAVGLFAMGGYDDDDMFEITGEGPDDMAQKYELMSNGWRPFSIKFNRGPLKGTRMSYVDSPLFFTMAMAGTFNDYQKYNVDDETTRDNVLKASFGMMQSFYQQSYLSGVNDLFQAIDPNNPNAARKAFDLTLRPFQSVALPNIAKQTIRLGMEATDTPIKLRRKGVLERGLDGFVRDVPWMNDHLDDITDVFGDPVTPEGQFRKMFIPFDIEGEKPLHPYRQRLYEEAIFIGQPNSRKVYDENTGEMVTMSESQLSQYRRRSAQLFDDYMREAYIEIKDLDGDEFAREVTNVKRNAREDALYELFE